VRGSDADGAPVEFEAAGLLARIAQHETDHLDGVLFPDRLEGDDRRAALRAIRSIDYSSQVDKTVGKRAARIGSAFGAGKAAPGSAFGAGPRR
jgi:peptide deformylase